jgi:hypothetical protein
VLPYHQAWMEWASIHIVTCYEWLQTGFRLNIGFTDHLRVVTTNNCNTISIFYKITVYSSTHSSCLVTASNNGYSSASRPKSSLNGGSLPISCFYASCPPYTALARITVKKL